MTESGDDAPAPEQKAISAETAAFTALSQQAVTESRFCNRVALVGGPDGLISLVFGFSGSFPNPSGEQSRVPRTSVLPAAMFTAKVLQQIVNNAASRYGMVASPESIARHEKIVKETDG